MTGGSLDTPLVELSRLEIAAAKCRGEGAVELRGWHLDLLASCRTRGTSAC